MSHGATRDSAVRPGADGAAPRVGPRRALGGRFLALGLAALLLPAPGIAQVVGDPPTATYLGSRPVKTPGGPDVSWNGTAFQVRPGGAIHWTIDVIHDDPASSMAIVTIDDHVPGPADYPVLAFSFPADVLAQPSTGTVTYEPPWLHDRNIELPFGQRAALVLRTRVAGTATPGSQICNIGLVNYLSPPPPPGLANPTYAYTITPAGEDTMTCVTVATDPNLAESHKVARDENGDGVIQPGERVDYTITVRNVGSTDATSIQVTDDLDPLLAPGAAGQGGAWSGQRVTWTAATTPALARLRPGQSTVLTFAATAGCVDDGGSLCNQAELRSAGTPPVLTDDPSDAALSSPTCLPTARAELDRSPLVATDASGDGIFTPGEALAFELEVTNRGGETARDVVVTLNVPAHVVSVAPRSGGVLAGGQVRWDATADPRLAAIPAGGSVSLGFDAIVSTSAGHGDQGCARGTLETRLPCPPALSDDPAAPGLTDQTCFTVSREPRLTLITRAVPSGGGSTITPGEILEVEAVVRWVAGAPASDVVVTLDLPDATVLGGLSATGSGIISGSTITWTPAGTPALALVGPGDVVVLSATGTLLCGAADGSAACSSGALTATNLSAAIPSDDEALPGAADPSCVAVAAPSLVASLTVAEASGNGLYEPGESITGSLLVRNEGSAPAREVSVTLPLPAADMDIVPAAGGRLTGSTIVWDAATTPALASLAPAASTTLAFSARIDPSAAGTRSCRQATLASLESAGCPDSRSDDPQPAGTTDPTCFDVDGDGLPPAEVPDGDPASGGPVPVTMHRVGADLLIRWSPAARALTYHVYRGEIASFRDGPWTNPARFIDDPEDPVPSCSLAQLEFTDRDACAPGVPGHYFLVAGRNRIGDGPLGESFAAGVFTERPPVGGACP